MQTPNQPKIFKSSIMPTESSVVLVRNQASIAPTIALEIVHILCVIAILTFIFRKLWTAAVSKTRKAGPKKSMPTPVGFPRPI